MQIIINIIFIKLRKVGWLCITCDVFPQFLNLEELLHGGRSEAIVGFIEEDGNRLENFWLGPSFNFFGLNYNYMKLEG